MPRLRKMAAALDSDKDGRISRRDMLKAFRRDRQLADHLRMPPRIKVRACCKQAGRRVTVTPVIVGCMWL
jgi:hypothetical protein